MRTLPLLVATSVILCGWPAGSAPDTRPLRIICFGAHPDDCELQAGGVAAMWAARGHKVKFVSTTNGDIGHWGMAGGPLAQRRTEEPLSGLRVALLAGIAAVGACPRRPWHLFCSHASPDTNYRREAKS